MKNATPPCPGPWRASGTSIQYIDHGNWITVARAENQEFTHEGNASNARLIASAPELLAALQSLLYAYNTENMVPVSVMSSNWDAARAAIAKATGEEVV